MSSVLGTERRAVWLQHSGGRVWRVGSRLVLKESHRPGTADTQQSHRDLPGHPFVCAAVGHLPILGTKLPLPKSGPRSAELSLRLFSTHLASQGDLGAKPAITRRAWQLWPGSRRTWSGLRYISQGVQIHIESLLGQQPHSAAPETS